MRTLFSLNFFRLMTMALAFSSLLTSSPQAFAKAELSDLFLAIKKEKRGQIKKLAKEIGVNTSDESGQTALLYAVHEPPKGWFINGRTNRKIIKDLVKLGAKVDVRDNAGRGVFHYFTDKIDIFKADLKRANLLVELGAQVAIKDLALNTPLILMARNAVPKNPNAGEQVAMAGFLISKGVDPNAKNVLGESALYYATALGNEALVTFLLSKKADAKEITPEGKTLVELLLENNNPDFAVIKRIQCLLVKAGAAGTCPLQ